MAVVLEKFSMGVGDRFGHQGRAQLSAMISAADEGINVVPVWNKSHREHTTIGSGPGDVRKEADNAVSSLNWKNGYYVDADHIGLGNVELFIDSSDFFTLDVADFTGKKADGREIQGFVEKYSYLAGKLDIPGLSSELECNREKIAEIAEKYLLAVREAGKIYRKIESVKGKGSFVTEVSMDETDEPQTPLEMLFILAAVADEGIPAQTIAPKFSGRFNKGVDYVGDSAKFAEEFSDDVAVIAFAVKEFSLPENLKLSVHSGSDKFSIYPCIKETLQKTGAGLHLKTAGTTWLEEVIGLAEAGGEALALACDIYEKALAKFDELCAPYATVIDIRKENLPAPETVRTWSGNEFTAALRHNLNCPDFNSDFRQLLHVGYKVAALMGTRYTDMLKEHSDIIAGNVSYNILERHIKAIFPAG